MAKKRKKTKEKVAVHSEPTQKVIKQHPSSNHWMQFAAIAIFTFGLYAMTYDYGYVLDDTIVYTDNSYVKKGISGVWDIFSTESFQGYFGEQKDLVEGARYRPLSLATFALEYEIWQQSPGKSHIINILLYILGGILLYKTLFLLDVGKSNQKWLSVAFIATILFMAHPLHVEAVANIKGRDEIMSFIGSFAALFFSVKYVDSKKWLHLFLALATYFLGLLAKENTITFLAVIPLSIYFFRNQSVKSILKLSGALLLTSLLYLFIRYQVIGYFLSAGNEITDVMNNPFVGMSFHEKIATIFHTLGVYLKLHFFPHPLTHDYYPYHIPISTFADIRAIVPSIVFLGLGGLGIYGLRQKRVYAYCILFFVISISIVSNLFVGVGTFMNERFVFTASAGFCLFAAYYLLAMFKKESFAKWISMALIAVMIIGFTAKSAWRIPAWKNALSLNSAGIKVSKNSARLNSFMATALFNTYKETTDRTEKKRLLDEAKIYSDRAIEILPFYKNGNLMKVGIASEDYKFTKDLPQMLGVFEEVMKRRPDIDHIHNYLEYLNKRGYNGQLMDWYLQAAKNTLVPAGKHEWALHYLNYAYTMDRTDKRILRAIATSNEALGNHKAAATFRNAANQ